MRLKGFPFGRSEFRVESLSAHRVPDKLREAGIFVYSAESAQKNVINVQVGRKDAKKVFAILRGSCYNVKKVRSRGLARVADGLKKSAGAVAGILLFTGAVLFCEGRVLKIEVTGSGAYYEQEILSLLSENGIGAFSALPEDTAKLTAEILSLPRVSFCSVSNGGGILTVTVETEDDAAPVKREPLIAPIDGVVKEIVVVRGAALVSEGDSVRAGDTLVSNLVAFGKKEREVVVIARVKLQYPFSAVYALNEEAAVLQAALDFGELGEINTEVTAEGVRVYGTATVAAAVNLS